jgi:hypothetical protein
MQLIVDMLGWERAEAANDVATDVRRDVAGGSTGKKRLGGVISREQRVRQQQGEEKSPHGNL